MRKVRRSFSMTPYLLIAPAVLWVIVFSIWPFLNTVVLSFTDARPLRVANPVGLANYVKLFSDERFMYALGNSLVYVLLCVPLLTFLPLFLALFVERKVPAIGFFRTTYYFPVIASVVVVGIIWSWFFESQGIINQTIQMLGLTDQPIPFLIDHWWIVGTAISLTVWKGMGYYMVVYLASLANVSKELHEAALLDGAGPIRRFWSVTVPAIRPSILLVSALITVAGMRVFSELYVLTNGTGGPGGEAMSIVMMVQQAGKGLSGHLGYASAISVVLFLLTILPLTGVTIANYMPQIQAWRDKRAMRKNARVSTIKPQPARA